MMPPLSAEIIVKAESFPGIKAGIARLEDILKSPSYQVVPDGPNPPPISLYTRPRAILRIFFSAAVYSVGKMNFLGTAT